MRSQKRETYSIDPAVLNRIDLSQSGQYCPIGGTGWVMFTQHVTVPAAGRKFHLALDIPRDNGSAGLRRYAHARKLIAASVPN